MEIRSPHAARALVEATIARLPGLDATVEQGAREREDRLTKPRGALGRIEELSIRLAAITGEPRPIFARKAVIVAAADHGVAAGGVSAYPVEVTAAMVRNFLAGGAAINVMARAQGATVFVVDAGVATDPLAGQPAPPPYRYASARIRPGSADIRQGPAMSREEAWQALAVGIDALMDVRARGLDCVATGDMGIGNTTAAAAVIAACTGAPAGEVVGRGTGVDDAGLARKREAVTQALASNRPDPRDGIDVLHKVGGLEIGVLVGVILGAAAERVPVLLDGVVSGAAALLVRALAPTALDACLAAHRSAEPAHSVALEALCLRPYLDLEMRLGEGTGAVLAFALVEAAWRTLEEMATFDEARVPDQPGARNG